MKNSWIKLFGISIVLLMVAIPIEAQVSIRYYDTFCQIGEDCTLEVRVDAPFELGRLAVVLQFDNSLITVTGLTGGGFMPVQSKLDSWNDICTVTTLCNAPGGRGQIDYLGLDTSNTTSGSGILYTVTYRVNATTGLSWGPCEAWCNTWICVSLTPFAGNYDGTGSQSMSYYPGTIKAEVDPLVDSDNDCIPDLFEIRYGTDPNNADTDNDGLMDGSCSSEDLNDNGVVDPGETDPRDADSDDDGVLDGTELGLTAPESGDTDLGAGHFIADADPNTTTDPTNSDSDGDGVLDGVEDANRNGAYDASAGESDPGDDNSVLDTSPPSGIANVLLLGDGDAEDQVQAALEAAGHTVTVVDYYYDWDGINPNPRDFNVVVLLDGYDYRYDLQATAGNELATFVASGGGLVVTEWTAYDVCNDDKTGPIVDLMPVEAPDCDYDSSVDWSVITTHSMTSGVPATWSDDAGLSIVAPKGGSIVLVRDDDQTPMLTYRNGPGGIVVHLNHTMTYDTSTIEPNALQLLVDAVAYSISPAVFYDNFEFGDLAFWSSTVGSP